MPITWVGPFTGEEYCTDAMCPEDTSLYDYGDLLYDGNGNPYEVDWDDKTKHPNPPKTHPPSGPPPTRPPCAPPRVTPPNPPRVRTPA